MRKIMTRCVDAHHHLWKYSAEKYGWIGDEMPMLRRDFLPPELYDEMIAAGVQASIAIQARQTFDETRWLLHLAEQHAYIAGVVGWAPIADSGFREQLETLAGHPKLKGLRHVLQDEPDDYMLRGSFQRGLAALQGTGLVYDILIYERQLSFATQLVDRHPNQVFVLDHLAKPKICAAEISPWRRRLRELALRPNVHCKLSGMVTEADWNQWKIVDLHPYVEVAVECFGPARLLAGSDWPVCTIAASYGKWWQTLRELISGLSSAEQAGILGGNASRVYSLSEEAL